MRRSTWLSPHNRPPESQPNQAREGGWLTSSLFVHPLEVAPCRAQPRPARSTRCPVLPADGAAGSPRPGPRGRAGTSVRGDRSHPFAQLQELARMVLHFAQDRTIPRMLRSQGGMCHPNLAWDCQRRPRAEIHRPALSLLFHTSLFLTHLSYTLSIQWRRVSGLGFPFCCHAQGLTPVLALRRRPLAERGRRRHPWRRGTLCGVSSQ